MSSLKDLASLIMVPSLYKDGRLDTVKPLGNGILHPDSTGNNDGTDGSTPAEGNFTFSRGSNLAATRVDVNGLIEKGRENLLLQSNSFDTTWANAGSTETGGQAGYDGTNNAWLLDKSGVNGRIQQSIVSSGLQTYSVYLKAGSSNWVFLLLTTNIGDQAAYFNLTNGSIGVGTRIDAKSEDVGNGWWRCSVTFNATTSTARIYVADGNGNVSGTSGSIYIQDAQLEQGLVATDYIETGTSAAQSGILEDMPRLDYSGGASCPSLLLEPQRTNELAHSEYIGAFGASNVSVTNNTEISPQGVRNAATIEVTNQTAVQGIAQGFVADGSSLYTISAYYKKTTSSIRAQLKIRNLLGSGTTYGFVDFDLSDGDVSSSIGTYSITSFNEDWWYVVVTTSTAPSAGIIRAIVRLDNKAVGTEVSVFGFQVESASYPTSYIPTYGSSVTRSYDVCKKTNIDSLIAEEGTAFIDVTNGDENEVNAFMTIADSSVYPDHIWIGQNGTTLSLYVKANDSYSLIANNIVSIEGRKKIAVVYTNESIKVFVNGTNEYTTLNKTLPSQLNRVELNAFNTSINTGTARYDQAILFPTALTDSECIALTTL